MEMGTEVRWGVESKALTLTTVLDMNSYFTFNFISAKRSMSGDCWRPKDISDNMAGEGRSNWESLWIGNARFAFPPKAL